MPIIEKSTPTHNAANTRRRNGAHGDDSGPVAIRALPTIDVDRTIRIT